MGDKPANESGYAADNEAKEQSKSEQAPNEGVVKPMFNFNIGHQSNESKKNSGDPKDMPLP